MQRTASQPTIYLVSVYHPPLLYVARFTGLAVADLDLVRYMRCRLFAAGVLLTACTVAPLQITGPYASRLCDSDVQQIKAAVAAVSRISQRVRTIDAIRRNRVRVEVGVTIEHGWRGRELFVIRRGPTWQVDKQAESTAISEGVVY